MILSTRRTAAPMLDTSLVGKLPKAGRQIGAARLRSDPEKAVDRVSRIVEAAGVKDENAAS
jgi:hypothetical protein